MIFEGGSSFAIQSIGSEVSRPTLASAIFSPWGEYVDVRFTVATDRAGLQDNFNCSDLFSFSGAINNAIEGKICSCLIISVHVLKQHYLHIISCVEPICYWNTDISVHVFSTVLEVNDTISLSNTSEVGNACSVSSCPISGEFVVSSVNINVSDVASKPQVYYLLTFLS